MRFLADENFSAALVEALAAAGHDVVWVRALAPGASDRAVLALAIDAERVLLTFDKDFGELAAKTLLPANCGIVLLRVRLPRSDSQLRQLARRLGSRDDWIGHFSVIEPGRVRMRRLA
jgi:predicted nuclease of predicted toxin-antitoxin system